MDENAKKLRIKFVYLFNLAVEITKKDKISEEEMLQFSNEVSSFKRWLNDTELETALKKPFYSVIFSYSSLKKDILSWLPFFVSALVECLFNSIFTIHRKRQVNLFLGTNDRKLSLLNRYK